MGERYLLACVLLVFAVFSALAAEPFEARRTEDKIVLLPLENEAGEEDLKYLESAIPDSMASVFARSGFTLGDADASFSIDPAGPVRSARDKVRIYLDVRVQKWNEDLFAMRTRGDYTGIARRLGARYLVTGAFKADPEEDITRPRAVHAKLQIFDSASGKITVRLLESNLKSILADSAPAAEELRSAIQLPERFTVRFEGEEEVMVYLDEQYLGRSPLSAELPAGTYQLRLERDGRNSRLETIRVAGAFSVNTALTQKQGRCGLTVTSIPEGAEVYLDVTPIGKTPLSRSDLSCGTHRVRVSLADHVDRFQGVVMRPDTAPSVALTLVPGDTEKTFRDPGYAFLDFTYADLSFYSFINALGFYGGYAYYQARARTVENRARRIVPNLAFTQIQTMTLYHALLLEQNRIDAKAVMRKSKASAMAGGVMAAASFFFFYKSFESDYRETGEVGAFLSQRPEWSGTRTGQRFDAGYVIRF